MKRSVILLGGIILLNGCDDKPKLLQLSQQKESLTIEEMISSGKERLASECKKGDVSLNCEFLSGDLIGSGKWHHTQIFIHNSGNIDIIVDGKAFYQSDIKTNAFAGRETTTFIMKGMKGEKAEVNFVRSNDGASLNFDGFNSEGKRFVMGGIKLK